MKTAIIYYSKHQGNTKKLLDAIAEENPVTLIDITGGITENLCDYDCIGYASGIYYSKFHKSLLEFAANKMPVDKNTFFIYTCGAMKDSYTTAIAKAVSKRNASVLGQYGCLGYDTYGPFKLVGGVAKGHPDTSEIKGAVEFYNRIMEK